MPIRMSESTRRGFLKVAGAGAAAGAAVVAVGAAAKSGHKVEGAGAATSVPAHASGPLVAYVRDVRGAEVSVMVGETEVVVHDADLVARLVSARSRTAAKTSV
jgi:hypothetical protein